MSIETQPPSSKPARRLAVAPPPTQEAAAKRAPRRAWWRRSGTPIEVGTELVTQRVSSDSAYQLPPSPLRTWVDRQGLALSRPDRRKVKAVTRFWARQAPGAVVKGPGKILGVLWNQLPPVWVGARISTESLLLWTKAPELAAAAHAAEGNRQSALLEKYHHVKNRRIVFTGASATAVTGGGCYLYFEHPWWLALGSLSMLGVFDLIGSRKKPVKEFEPVRRQPFTDGMSFQSLVASVQAVFDEEVGIDDNGNPLVKVSNAVDWSAERKQYRITVSTYAKIKLEHLRALERGIGVPDNAIRMVKVPETATDNIIILQYGDPLPVVASAPFIPTGQLTINDALPLGESTADYPFAMHFAGAHVIVIGGTGAGKSSVHMNNIIDAISACRDAVLYGIDLTNGPMFSLWRKVIQKKAWTPEDADVLLDEILAEIDRRAGILNDIANDDNPDNDISEWETSLGPALIIIIDEFPELAKYDGTPKGTLNLLEKIERVNRTGRKHLVSLVIGVQKMGNSDTGSTVVSSQSGQVIVGPCKERDTVAVFGTDGRDFGYAPHTLVPGTPKSINDAGKAFVSAPGFGPDVVRGYGRLANAEIRRRAMQREADGLPQLGSPEPATEAVVVPPALAAVDAALLAYKADLLPTKFVVDHANRQGGNWTPSTFAEALRAECVPLGVNPPQPRGGRSPHSENKSINHYHRKDLDPVLKAL